MNIINYKKQINSQVYKINYILTVMLFTLAIAFLSSSLAYADVFDNMVDSSNQNSSVGLNEPFKSVTPENFVIGTTKNFILDLNSASSELDKYENELVRLYNAGKFDANKHQQLLFIKQIKARIQEFREMTSKQYDATKLEINKRTNLNNVKVNGVNYMDALKNASASNTLQTELGAFQTKVSGFGSELNDLLKTVAYDNLGTVRSTVMGNMK